MNLDWLNNRGLNGLLGLTLATLGWHEISLGNYWWAALDFALVIHCSYVMVYGRSIDNGSV